MSDPTSSLILPTGEKIMHRSDLFRVEVLGKECRIGLTKDSHILHIKLLENDPNVQREAWVLVPADVYQSVEKGERLQARLYEHPDGTWNVNPPVVP